MALKIVVFLLCIFSLGPLWAQDFEIIKIDFIAETETEEKRRSPASSNKEVKFKRKRLNLDHKSEKEFNTESKK